MVGNIVAPSHGDLDDKLSLVHMIPRTSEPARHDRHSFTVDITHIAVPRPVGSAGHHEVKTATVQEVLGRAPIGFDQFIEDHRSTWAA